LAGPLLFSSSSRLVLGPSQWDLLSKWYQVYSEISKSRLQRTSVTSIPLQTQVCCHGFSPDEEKLLLGCIDGSLVLFDEGRGITHLVKAAFVRFYSKVNSNLQRVWIILVIRNFHNIYSYPYGLAVLGHNFDDH